jgi:hypothetical protein
MHGGKIVDAVIKAIIDKTDGLHYQVDFGKEQTALSEHHRWYRIDNGPEPIKSGYFYSGNRDRQFCTHVNPDWPGQQPQT